MQYYRAPNAKKQTQGSQANTSSMVSQSKSIVKAQYGLLRIKLRQKE
jgi:hypothetical protein